MPQAKRGGSSSRSSTSKSGAARRSASGARSGARARSATGAGSGARARSATGAGSAQAGSASGTADPRIEAVAERVRKLNERIIEAGRGAGEATLTSYEKALGLIASTIERGPGSSDVEWISGLATAQANFIRDMTEAWTAAARNMLK